MNEIQTHKQIVAACQRLYQRNCLAAADGNISVRLDENRILITPSGVSKAFMSESEMAAINLAGEVLKGKPSSESAMHLAIYRACPEAKAVVHAHPPHAIAWSVQDPRREELPSDVLSEVILAAGRIPIVPYARPSTEAMGDVLKTYLPQTRLMILERHGGLAWGESLDEALMGIERLEHSAQILWLAQTLGKIRHLEAGEVSALRAMREKMGNKLL